MNVIVVLMALAACLSVNIPAIAFIVGMLWLTKRAYSTTQTSIAFYLFVFLAYPQTFIGETDADRNMVLLFSLLFLAHALWRTKRSDIRLGRGQIAAISVLCLTCLVVYAPIPLANLLAVNVWDGAAEQYVSNFRGTYMLTFVVPVLAAPLVAVSVMRGVSDRTDFGRLYAFLKVVLWIVILPSFLRYALNMDFIPQEYTPVRYEGRLSAFMHPDSLGYGRRLLLPIALVATYALSSRKYRKDFVLLSLLLVTVAMTLGRTTYVSAIVVLSIVMAYNVTIKRLSIALGLIGTLGLLLTVTGVMAAALARNVGTAGGVNLSGRNVIWGAALQVIAASPFVGLRPGGWIVLLQPGDVTFFGLRVAQQSAHSFYLQTAVDWGIPVLVILVSFVLHAAVLMNVTVRRLGVHADDSGSFHLRNWAIAIQAAMVGLLVHGVTETISTYLLFFLIGLSWSLYFVARHPSSFGALLGPRHGQRLATNL